MFRSFTAAALLASALVSANVMPAAAQHYPTKQSVIYVPFTAGGTADIFARMLGQHLQDKLGKPYIVENVAGGGSIIGVTKLAKSTPDGHHIGLASTSALAIFPTLYGDKLTYNVEKELIPLGQVSMVPNVLVVNPEKIKARSVPELIAYLKANPDKVTFGSAGNGTSQHLAGELFQQMAGVKMTHVPYKGSSQMLQDLLSGTIDLAFDNVPLIIPHHKAGKLTMLASATDKRAEFDPNLPTVAETLPGFEAVAWHGFFVPAGTPKPIVEKLAGEVQAFMKLDATQKRFRELGATPMVVSGADFATYIKSENDKWSKVIKTANVKPD